VSQLEKYLTRWTGCGRRYWMLWIEETIESQSLPLTPKEVQQYIDRGEVVPAGKMDLAHDWLADLAKKLLSFVNLSSGDGNIARARVLSLIVTLWTCRVIRAKCHNTHYPKKDRKKRGITRVTWRRCRSVSSTIPRIICIFHMSGIGTHRSSRQRNPLGGCS